jgi:hypothetical protein
MILHATWIGLSWNSNEEKWDVDQCKKYWKSTSDYGVEKSSIIT